MYIVSDSSSIWFQGFWVKQGRLIGQLLCKLRPTSDTWFTGTGTPYHRLQYAQPFWHVWSIQMLREDCVHVNFVAVTWKPENHHHVTDADTHQRDILYPNKHESGEMTQTWKQTIYSPFGPKRPLSCCKEGTSNSTFFFSTSNVLYSGFLFSLCDPIKVRLRPIDFQMWIPEYCKWYHPWNWQSIH